MPGLKCRSLAQDDGIVKRQLSGSSYSKGAFRLRASTRVDARRYWKIEHCYRFFDAYKRADASTRGICTALMVFLQGIDARQRAQSE
jgi:hypothetical protein